MVEYGWMIDLTKCIGCRSCQVACKRWNNRSAEKTTFSSTWTNPESLSPQTWTIVKFKLKHDKGTDKIDWHFIKWQCMHCDDAPCLNACPTKAIYKRPDGIVRTHDDRCIGCGNCVMACPYEVRHKDPVAGTATFKCDLCWDRVGEGKLPACTQACPTETLVFGTRDSIVAKAKARAATIGGYIYGLWPERNLANTVVYVSKVPFEKLGFPDLNMRLSASAEVQRDLALPIGGLGVVGAAGLVALAFILRRRRELEKTSGVEK